MSFQSLWIERLLIFFLIVFGSLDGIFSGVDGISLYWYASVFLVIWSLIFKTKNLKKIIGFKLYFYLCVWLLFCACVEFFHIQSQFNFLNRLTQATLGSICLSSLLTTEKSLKISIYGIIASGLFICGSLFYAISVYGFNVYSSDFYEEVVFRKLKIFNTMFSDGATNAIAPVLLCSLIGIFWLIRYEIKSIVFKFICTFLFLANLFFLFSLMSRGAVLYILIWSIFEFKNILKTKSGKIVFLCACVFVLFFIPDAFWSRFGVNVGENNFSKAESRVVLYENPFKNIEDFIWFGVGDGYYFKTWAIEKGLSRANLPIRVHNAFLNVWIIWGVFSLIGLLSVLVLIRRYLPKPQNFYFLSYCIRGFSIVLFLSLFVRHTLYDKYYFIIVAMISGYYFLDKKSNYNELQ